jgi:hypothetical protein
MLPTDNINLDKSVHTTPQHKIKTSYKNTTNYKLNADEITISSLSSTEHRNNILTETIPHQHQIQSTYTSQYNTNLYPPHLPVHRSSHPIDKSIISNDIHNIRSAVRQPANTQLHSITGIKYTSISIQNFQDLLTHGCAIRDSILYQHLAILSKGHNNIFFLDTNFFNDLSLMGWDYAHRKYFYHYQSRTCHNGSKSKPKQHGIPTILIPVHVQGFHWVAVARHEINETTKFFYSDDLNNTETEEYVKGMFIQKCMGTAFYPVNTEWIHVNSTTFTPHSNECGPRTLLALTIMGLHPRPHPFILTPIMHPNIAQILRIWIAKTILYDAIDTTPLQSYLTILEDPNPYHSDPNPYHSSFTQSNPYNLFHLDQTAHAHTNIPDRSKKTISTGQSEEADTNTGSGPPCNTYPQITHKDHTHFEQHQNIPNDIDKGSDDPLAPNLSSQHTESVSINLTQPKITNWMVNRSSTQDNKISNTNFNPDKEMFGTPLQDINPMETLRIIAQNPQYSLQASYENEELMNTILNLQQIRASIYTAISPNIFL